MVAVAYLHDHQNHPFKSKRWVRFGTADASIASLYDINPHRLKLAQSFTDDIVTNENRRTLTAATISMARRFNTLVIAPNIQDKAQIQVLKLLGADILQGFALEKPMTPQAFLSWIRKLENQFSLMNCQILSTSCINREVASGGGLW